jgi:hypothetical protein
MHLGLEVAAANVTKLQPQLSTLWELTKDYLCYSSAIQIETCHSIDISLKHFHITEVVNISGLSDLALQVSNHQLSLSVVG